MAYKVSSKYTRGRYNGTLEEIHQQINSSLNQALDSIVVPVLRFYTPSRDSIKILLHSENEINKILDKAETLKGLGFEPRISLTLKSARTAYCFGFDPSLLQTFDADRIKSYMEDKHWNGK